MIKTKHNNPFFTNFSPFLRSLWTNDENVKVKQQENPIFRYGEFGRH